MENNMSTCEPRASTAAQSLPYGVAALDPQVVIHPEDCDRVRCYVRGCRHFLRRPRRNKPGELCPDHGIYCHYSRYGATYSYADVRRNIIASPELFAQRVVGHPFKYESHRLGSENSEDALSWNVFRSLQEAHCLAAVARLFVGEEHPEEPALYLWGIRVDDNSFEPWNLLIAARQEFEANLPVKRPLTEPDIALHLPGKYLVLIEAKFTSPNPVYCRGPRRDAQSLTLEELLGIYWRPELQTLDYLLAQAQTQIHYQLWRNMVFAEWMSRLEGPVTKPYHVNLLRQVAHTAVGFTALLDEQFAGSFRTATWESLSLATGQGNSHPSGETLRSHLRSKTAHLVKALET